MKLKSLGFLLTFPLIVSCVSGSGGSKTGDDLAAVAASHVKSEHLAAWRKNQPGWYEAITPFRIIGNNDRAIYYVGTRSLGMYFIPTDEGHIVIDGGMPDQGGYVADQIRKLGHDPADIKILLNTHAHLDHSGGLAELKALSGAQLLASKGDRSALEGGFYLGSEDQASLNAPPVKVDRIIKDTEKVTLGGVSLTAHITPGHSRGCTSWTMDMDQGGRSYQAVVFCSATVAGNRLVALPDQNGAQYEGIVDDYRRTFTKTSSWKPDIPLANHPGFFGMMKKREKLLAGDSLAFVDRDGFPNIIARLETAFERALAKQANKLAD